MSSSFCVYSWSLERKSENEVEGNWVLLTSFLGMLSAHSQHSTLRSPFDTSLSTLRAHMSHGLCIYSPSASPCPLPTYCEFLFPIQCISFWTLFRLLFTLYLTGPRHSIPGALLFTLICLYVSVIHFSRDWTCWTCYMNLIIPQPLECICSVRTLSRCLGFHLSSMIVNRLLNQCLIFSSIR